MEYHNIIQVEDYGKFVGAETIRRTLKRPQQAIEGGCDKSSPLLFTIIFLLTLKDKNLVTAINCQFAVFNLVAFSSLENA